ncbi:hypothetical protein L226DRAFT_470776, partial [Lentinus tigrinus ALCF2SS1-7]
VRDMLPARPLPCCLNPNWVDCDVKQLPMVWFGAPYDHEKVIPFAIENGFGDNHDPEDEIYDANWTWVNLVERFYEEFGIHLCLKEVWGYPEGLVLAFYANRDMRIISKRQRRLIENTYRAMGYEDEDMQWWLDRDEEVGPGRAQRCRPFWSNSPSDSSDF